MLGFLEHAEILEPPDMRAEMSSGSRPSWRRRVIGGPMSPRPVAGAEVQRILAIVPWIVAHPGASKDEIATRFGMTAEQLDDDLALVLMIGVPPYSPGDYLDVDDDGEFVTIRLADQFSRPLRLTPAEGLALLAAGRALLAVPGSDPEGPLATALAKLERRARPPGGRRRGRRADLSRSGPRRRRRGASASRSTTGRPAATS